MAGMRLEFAQFGNFDSFSVYRSDTPMNISSLPEPIATGIKQMYFIDGTALAEKRYYYRVAVIRGSKTLLSDEILSPDSNAAPVENIPTDYILRYDFNGNVEDKSTSGLNGVLAGAVTFGAGRIAYSKAAIFDGGTVKTIAPLPINSEKISISFWFKTNNSMPAFLMTLGVDSTPNRFIVDQNNSTVKGIGIEAKSGSDSNIAGQNFKGIDGLWHHALFTVDRTKTTHGQITNAYIDNVLAPVLFVRSSVLSGLFNNAVLTIGSHTNNSFVAYPYIGQMQQLRIYNRLLTENERLQLFEE